METVGVLGAGSLGTLLASRLAGAGHAVRALTRSVERRRSLEREAPLAMPVEAASGLEPATLIFLCVKSRDTAAAARELAGIRTEAGICSLQNGWGHMDLLEDALPRSPLLAAATALGAYFDDSGALHASTNGLTSIAPWKATEYRWAEYAATLFESAGLKAEARRDAETMLWRKLVLNAAVNPLSVLGGAPNGAILDSPALLRIAEIAALEGTEVGVRAGRLPESFDPAPHLHRLLEDTRGNRSSMAEDLARRRPTEIDAIVGSIVREAAALQVTVPVLEALLALVRAAEAPRKPA